MATLVFDIETIGENFDELDETTQGVLTRWVEQSATNDEEREVGIKNIREGLGFSPLTGSIVAIGVLDYEKNKGVVYYDSPDVEQKEEEIDGVVFKAMNEHDMLENFWKGAEKYSDFVSFNGRAFDAPFLNARSAINGVTPSRDLMADRYMRFGDTKHWDLADQLSYYGAVRKAGSLHLWCRAFGIESPKAEGVAGDDVALLFKEKKYKDIALYNARDIKSTAKLYEKWKAYFRF